MNFSFQSLITVLVVAAVVERVKMSFGEEQTQTVNELFYWGQNVNSIPSNDEIVIDGLKRI